MNCKPEDFVDIANTLGDKLLTLLDDNAERVVICYNEFQSVMTQEPIAKQILPMQLESGEMEAGTAGEYLYEPNGQEILADLLPRSLRSQLLQSFLDTSGEQAARMQAMDNATNNAGEMIIRSLVYNRGSTSRHYD